jgi:hypothetical protein
MACIRIQVPPHGECLAAELGGLDAPCEKTWSAHTEPSKHRIETAASIILQVGPTMTAGTWRHSFAVALQLSLTTISCSRARIGLASASCKPTSSAERQVLWSSVPNCVVAMLSSSRRQLTVMVNSNFASSSIGQPNIAWPRTSTGPQVFTGLRSGFDSSIVAGEFAILKCGAKTRKWV